MFIGLSLSVSTYNQVGAAGANWRMSLSGTENTAFSWNHSYQFQVDFKQKNLYFCDEVVLEVISGENAEHWIIFAIPKTAAARLSKFSYISLGKYEKPITLLLQYIWFPSSIFSIDYF